MSPAFRPFNFVIPSLPKETYEFVQRVAKRYEMSHRQVVIVALQLLEARGVDAPDAVESLFMGVKATHPSRVTRA